MTLAPIGRAGAGVQRNPLVHDTQASPKEIGADAQKIRTDAMSCYLLPPEKAGREVFIVADFMMDLEDYSGQGDCGVDNNLSTMVLSTTTPPTRIDFRSPCRRN
jgi:hypothetical protein